MLAGITALFTCYNVNARSFTDNYDSRNYSNGNGSTTEVNNFKFNKNNSFIYTIDSNNSGNLYSNNPGDFQYFVKWYVSNGTRQHRSNYNFIKLIMNNPNNPNTSSWEFYTWDDHVKSYSLFETPGIGYSDTINGETVSFDMWFPYHGTFVLYSSETHHTIQLIGSKRIIDKVLYVDPYQSIDNVYIIDFYRGKAWSITYPIENNLDKLAISSLMFGDIGNVNEFLKSFEDMVNIDGKSYTIENGGTYFFPPTYSQGSTSYYDSSDGRHEFSTETSYYGLTRYYKPDGNFESPDWGDGNNGNNSGDNSMDRYNKCIENASSVQLASKYQSSCINTIDGEHTTWDLYSDYYNYIKNYSGTGTYTGLVRSQSCMNWINYTTGQFSSWGANYSLWVNYAYDWANGVEFDAQEYCSRYLPNGVNTEQGWLCEYMCIGCDDYSVFGSEFITGAVSCIKEKIVEPIAIFTWYPISDSFMSGYNYFGAANSCNEDLYGKSYVWGNFLIAFIVGWLVIAFYTIFK